MRYGVEDMDTVTVDDRHVLKVETADSWRSRTGPVAKHWWLLRDGTPVAFLHTLTYPGDTHGECPFVLCDIEVRDGYRGQGLTRLIVSAAEKIEGKPIWTSGGFTPLGAQALSWLPVCPWETPGVKYQDMPFVHDWDSLHPINLL